MKAHQNSTDCILFLKNILHCDEAEVELRYPWNGLFGFGISYHYDIKLLCSILFAHLKIIQFFPFLLVLDAL